MNPSDNFKDNLSAQKERTLDTTGCCIVCFPKLFCILSTQSQRDDISRHNSVKMQASQIGLVLVSGKEVNYKWVDPCEKKQKLNSVIWKSQSQSCYPVASGIGTGSLLEISMEKCFGLLQWKRRSSTYQCWERIEELP